jgi:uncharacterized membrane protein YphA (DoxX/SURF4 family)
MKPVGAFEWSALVVRVLLGTWFVYSGGMKLWGSGLDRFTQDIANYQLVRQPLDAWVAYTVPWFELVAGFCLVLGIWLRGALITIAGLVLGFVVFVGWAWAHGLDISCGCTGSGKPIHYWGKAAEFALYAVLLAALWRMESRRQAPAGQNLQNMA